MIRTPLSSSVLPNGFHKSRSCSSPGLQRLAAAQRGQHALPDGMKLEVLSDLPADATNKPPLVFIHGSAHGAWCWQEHFLPYFAEKGYPSYALSLRGHGESEGRELKYAGTLHSTAEDILDFVKTLESKPVVLGHSFTALTINLLSLEDRQRYFSGFAVLAPTPPTGNGNMIRRMFKRGFLKSLKLSWVLVRRTFQQDPKLARLAYFSADLPEETLLKYQTRFEKMGETRLLDIFLVQKSLPLPQPGNLAVPAFVLGSESDALVDEDGLKEAAEWYGTEPVIVNGLAHDLMLDTRWETAAEALSSWLDAAFKEESS